MKGKRLLLAGMAATVLFLGGMILLLRSDVGRVQADTSSASVTIQREALGQRQITVTVAGAGLTDLGGFEFDLMVDPAVAQVQGAQVGDFLGSSGRTVGALGPIIGSQGETVGFGAYSYDPSGNNAPGANGGGTLALVHMSVVSDGVSSLILSNTLFADVNATQQQVSTAGAVLQVRTHHVGWNLMALCVDTSGLSVTETLQSMTGGYDMVLGEDGTYVAGLPDMFQSLDEMDPSRSYYVRATGDVTMTQVAPAFDPSTPISLTVGWHWIGYCVAQAKPVTVALSSIAGKYDMVLGESGTYVVGLPDMFQSLREMRQGEGYQIRMTADGTLVYPAVSGQSVVVRAKKKAHSPGACSGVRRTPRLTLAYGDVQVDGRPAPAGTVVQAVTSEGTVAGCAVVESPGHFGVMQIYGVDSDGATPGFRPGETISWKVNGREATASPDFRWSDDRDVHRVSLVTGENKPIFLPLLER